MEENTQLPEQTQESQDAQVENITDPLDKRVGTKEPKRLEAKLVKVVDIVIVPQYKKGEDKAIGNKAIFMCQHTDSEELIKLSTVKYLKEEDKIADSGTWYGVDEDGNIAKLSALAKLMTYYKQDTLKRLIGKELETIVGKNNYLSIKAY